MSSKSNCGSSNGALVSLEDVCLQMAYCPDTYCNLDRQYAAIGYLAPNHFETHWQTTSQRYADWVILLNA